MRNDLWDRLYREVFSLKESLPDDAEAKRRGFSVLFNPPRPNRLLLIGLNPSRSDGTYIARHPESEQYPPGAHLYTEARGGKLAKAMHEIVSRAEGDVMSPDAVWDAIISGNKINLIFFGSANLSEWNSQVFWGSGGSRLRRLVETSCGDWVRNIYQHLRPTGILCEGLETFDRCCRLGLGDVRVKNVTMRPGREGQRLLVEAQLVTLERQIPLFGILHPTGGRARSEHESVLIGNAVARFCERSFAEEATA